MLPFVVSLLLSYDALPSPCGTSLFVCAYARSTDQQTRPMLGSLTERWVALYHHAPPPASTSDWSPTSFLLAFRECIYCTSSDTRAVFSGLSRPDVALSPLLLRYTLVLHKEAHPRQSRLSSIEQMSRYLIQPRRSLTTTNRPYKI